MNPGCKDGCGQDNDYVYESDASLMELGISNLDISMEDFGSLSGLFPENTVFMTPDSPEHDVAGALTVPRGAGAQLAGPRHGGADPIPPQGSEVPEPAPFIDFACLTDGYDPLRMLQAMEPGRQTSGSTPASPTEAAALPVVPAGDQQASDPQVVAPQTIEISAVIPLESGSAATNMATSSAYLGSNNGNVTIKWKMTIPADEPAPTQQQAVSGQPTQMQPITEPSNGMQPGAVYPAFPTVQNAALRSYHSQDFSSALTGMDSGVPFAKYHNQAPVATPSNANTPEQPIVPAAAPQTVVFYGSQTNQNGPSPPATLRRNVIPVVSYSRDQLTVISERVQAEAGPSSDPIQPQPGMNCAQYLSTVSFDAISDADDDDDYEPRITPLIEEPSADETNAAQSYVQIPSGYILPANGNNQVFPVHELYMVATEGPIQNASSPSSASSSGDSDYSPGSDDPQEGTSQGPRRKRQRRIRVDYQTDFLCVPCGKTFGKKGSLEQHKRNHHSTPRPWLCPKCGKSFITADKLQGHIANHNPDNKRFPCEGCDKRYVHAKDRDRHFTTHHGKPTWPCEECSKMFVRRDHLLAHIASHRRREERRLIQEALKAAKEAAKNKIEAMARLATEANPPKEPKSP